LPPNNNLGACFLRALLLKNRGVALPPNNNLGACFLTAKLLKNRSEAFIKGLYTLEALLNL
jgi:hypothetical protein